MKKGVLFILVLPLVMIIGLRRNSAPFFSVKKYCCVQDESLSENHFSSINNLLTGLLDDNLAACAIIDRLKEQFPVLRTVTLAYRPYAVQVGLSAYEPICCINDSFVLTAHNQLFSKDVFSVHAVSDIPALAVSHAHRENISLFALPLVQGLPYGIDHTHTCELINEHSVHFVDKNQPNFTIVSSVNQTKSPQLWAQCDLVKQAISERGGFNKGIRWIADTRFAHYIVAYKA